MLDKEKDSDDIRDLEVDDRFIFEDHSVTKRTVPWVVAGGGGGSGSAVTGSRVEGGREIEYFNKKKV